MSTTTPRRARSLTEGMGIPAVSDVPAPRLLSRAPRWLLGAVVLAALLVVSGSLHSRELGGNLWFNEAIAIGIATRSFGGVLHAARVGGSSPLYYLLLHFWINGFGDGASSARALSLGFALATIPVGGWAAWSLGGQRAAGYAAILFAFSAVLTQYAQQVQPYTLLVLLSIVAITAFLHGFVYRRRGYLPVFVVALEAALSTGLFIFGLAVALLVILRCVEPAERRAIARDAALCAAALLILFIPWLPATVDQIAHATSPWHYAPLIGASLPGDLIGGDRVDADLLVAIVMALGPFALVRSRRREPEAIVFWALLAVTVASIALAAVSDLASPTWISRYFMGLVATVLLLSALAAARTKIVGLAAVVLYIIFCLDPSAFASSHMSNMSELTAQLGGRLHRNDVVVVAQPEQTPLAHYYLAAGLRWDTTLGPTQDPNIMNWDGALTRLQHAAPRPTLNTVIASLSAGQQLLFIRPLTEGERDWKAPWAALVQLRAAQWGQLLSNDVANGTLTEVGSAPENYPGDCCVANSAVLYRKAGS
jgi:mannosyltransferase